MGVGHQRHLCLINERCFGCNKKYVVSRNNYVEIFKNVTKCIQMNVNLSTIFSHTGDYMEIV
jgi:hypothetical protein